MTTLKDQTDAQIAKTRSAKPEFMAKIESTLVAARKHQQGDNVIESGATAPDFQLPNVSGETVSLSHLLVKGPVVIVFYRGGWCPYCNLQLRALKEELSNIHSQGAELVAISPQAPDNSLSESEKSILEFPVLSDQNSRVATEYGIAWEVPELILEHMRKDRKLDLADINYGNGTTLPIPATFIVDTNGVVVWSHVDVDYRSRPEPTDVVAALQSITTKT